MEFAEGGACAHRFFQKRGRAHASRDNDEWKTGEGREEFEMTDVICMQCDWRRELLAQIFLDEKQRFFLILTFFLEYVLPSVHKLPWEG